MKREQIVKTINDLKGEAGHAKVVEVYNSQKPVPRNFKITMSTAWCAATVSAVFLMNGYDVFSECSCYYMIEKAKKAGLWEEKDSYKPKIGDAIMYDWEDDGAGDNRGIPNHTGIVIAVDGSNFTVREGNKKNTLGNRDMKVNQKYIRGYILPPYEANKPSKTEEETKTYYTVKKGDNLTAIAKKYKTTVKKLVELNNIKDPNIIHVGDKLRIK